MRTRVLASAIVCAACVAASGKAPEGTLPPLDGEKHFGNIRQLTFGGQNAEGYFSWDETRLIFQSTRDSLRCDQEFVMDLGTLATHMVSTGRGRTTCGFFLPGDRRILFSSTHLGSSECPPPPDYSRGYVWAVHPAYDIFTANPDGSDLRRLTTSPGYDAEATISPKGDRIVFTSKRDGDLDLYSMKVDGTDVTRLTDEPGYDGGAWYSPDGTKIVYRAWHDTDSAQLVSYRGLLRENLVRPARMEIFIMNADGSDRHPITHFGAASFAPIFLPDGKRIIFSSNLGDPKGRNFDLYLIDIDGSGLERVTTSESFDGFPMFSKDGKKLVFASGRNATGPRDLNLFIADWKE